MRWRLAGADMHLDMHMHTPVVFSVRHTDMDTHADMDMHIQTCTCTHQWSQLHFRHIGIQTWTCTFRHAHAHTRGLFSQNTLRTLRSCKEPNRISTRPKVLAHARDPMERVGAICLAASQITLISRVRPI
jgi:hypothetical protein